MFRRRGTAARLRPSVFKVVALCGVLAAASLAAAAPASAAIPETLTFHDAVLDTPNTGGVQVIKPTGTPLTITAQVTLTGPTTATFTVAPSDWHFPTYNLTKPAPGTLNVTLKNTANGTVNFATGAVTMTADLLSDVNITGVGDCQIDTGNLNFTTAAKQPLLGLNFPAGATGVNTGKGALGVPWSSLPAGTGPDATACTLINPYLAGVGGLWISGNITPPSLSAKVAKLKKVKPGKKAKIKETIKNAGQDASGQIKVCLSAKGLKPKSACKTVTNVAGGKSTTVTFTVKVPKKKAKKKYSLKLTGTPTATALAPFTSKATLKTHKK